MVDAVPFRPSIVLRVADDCDGSQRLVSCFEKDQLDEQASEFHKNTQVFSWLRFWISRVNGDAMLTSTLTEQMNNQQWSVIMTTTTSIDGTIDSYESAQPRLHQRSAETQAYATVTPMLPLDLEEPIRHEITEQLNQVLADTMTLRDLYKKSHWQVSGPTFYQLHLLFDKHYGEQAELVDAVAERIQLLGGLSIAMAHDVAEITSIERPPRGREEVPVQLSRLVDAHQTIISEVRIMARRATLLGDDGTNDLLVSQVLRTNELQMWFVSEHLVEMPLIHATR